MITTLINADEVEYQKDMEVNDRAQVFCQAHPRLAAIWDRAGSLWEQLMFDTLCRRGRRCDIDVDGPRGAEQ